MTLRIGDALRQGAVRTFERNGLILVGVFVVFGLLNAVVSQSLSGAYMQFMAEEFGTLPTGQGQGPGFGTPFVGSEQTALALPLPLGVALALSALFGVVAEALRIVSIRVFASAETQAIPGDLIRRNLPRAVLNSVVAGIVIGILTVIGLVFLVLPGIVVAISFFFVRQVIALEDENMIEAMERAWKISRGNRIELFILAAIVWLVGLVASVPAFAGVFIEPLVATILSIGVSGFVTVFGIAVATRAFEQLRSPATDEAEESSAEFGTTD